MIALTLTEVAEWAEYHHSRWDTEHSAQLWTNAINAACEARTSVKGVRR